MIFLELGPCEYKYNPERPCPKHMTPPPSHHSGAGFTITSQNCVFLGTESSAELGHGGGGEHRKWCLLNAQEDSRLWIPSLLTSVCCLCSSPIRSPRVSALVLSTAAAWFLRAPGQEKLHGLLTSHPPHRGCAQLLQISPLTLLLGGPPTAEQDTGLKLPSQHPCLHLPDMAFIIHHNRHWAQAHEALHICRWPAYCDSLHGEGNHSK